MKVFKYLKNKERIFIVLSFIFVILQVWLELKVPDYMSSITTLVQTDANAINEIMNVGMKMLTCAFLSLIVATIVHYLSSYVGTNFERSLRKEVFVKVNSFGMEEINKFSTSSLITRNTNDITQVRNFLVMGIQMLSRAPIMAIMALIKILGKDRSFSIITLIGVLIIIFLSLILITLAIPKFKKIQAMTDNLNRIARENLKGLKVVHAYNAEDYQIDKFHRANSELTMTQTYVQKLMALMDPVMAAIMSGQSLAIYWVGASLINKANIMDRIAIFSDMVVFSSYSVQIILSFMMLIIVFVMYPRAKVSMDRIGEVLNTTSKIEDGTVTSTKVKGEIEFKNVSFKYPDGSDYVLRNINFKANQGETVAIIGSTGAGKSTLVNLILRFYDVTEGSVLVDGVDVRDMKLSYLYNKIGYISQKAYIFKGSVIDNIRLGITSKGKVKKDSVIPALKTAQAYEFVSKMSDKEKTNLSQAGNNISGGQKQRVSIARAIARDPEIFIFDDSFSALDYKTDYRLRKELNKKTKNATKIIVAQRIGTIKDADKIIVLDDGICAGIGTHSELLKKCKVYKQIAMSQLSKEELDEK